MQFPRTTGLRGHAASLNRESKRASGRQLGTEGTPRVSSGSNSESLSGSAGLSCSDASVPDALLNSVS